MKVAVPVARNVLALTSAASATDAEIQNTQFWVNNFNYFKQRNEWHIENRSAC